MQECSNFHEKYILVLNSKIWTHKYYGDVQGCSLGLDVSVSRPIFPMSRSRLGEMWEGLGLGLGLKTKCLGLVSGLVPEGLVYKRIFWSFFV